MCKLTVNHGIAEFEFVLRRLLARSHRSNDQNLWMALGEAT